MDKKIRIKLSPEAEEVYYYLVEKSTKYKKERMILNAIIDKSKIITSNPRFGNVIPKKLIPKEYRLKYNITNLFRLELPLFWRMLYTLRQNSEIEIIAFILDILDHRTYDKKFRYNKK